jgi:phenylalanyl-tRNA synthetase beta chain
MTGLHATARTPDWLRERLRRAGLRSIHPVVDVTNYVMLEYGQPLHAYRLDKLRGAISVRRARPGESLTLLNGSDVAVDASTVVIADDSGAIGLAGIMGGAATAVDAGTDAILLESAFFAPSALLGQARRYGLHTDASIRFERGVDPRGQERAIERATRLIRDICGGSAGPVSVAEDAVWIHAAPPVPLNAARITARLGVAIPDAEVERLLGLLGMRVEAQPDGWRVTPPGHRFDIAIEEDLIEEIGRLYGYDRVPAIAARSESHPGLAPESAVHTDRLGDLLAARGYSEAVCYAFTSSAAQQAIVGGDGGIRLANPLSQDLDALRSSLWPGLLRTARQNFSHQMTRCRLFEIGTVFAPDGARVAESTHVAGLAAGPRLPLNWEGETSGADFFDVKGDVDAMLALWRQGDGIRYASATHPSLNPVRSATVLLGERAVGWIGELHPRLVAEYEFKVPVILFAVDLASVGAARAPRFTAWSRFPSIRRDLALIVDESLAAADLTKVIAEELGGVLQHQDIFDVYRGKGVDSGRKSVGIGLILQDASRTLTDKEADDMIQRVVHRLEREHGARIRT